MVQHGPVLHTQTACSVYGQGWPACTGVESHIGCTRCFTHPWRSPHTCSMRVASAARPHPTPLAHPAPTHCSPSYIQSYQAVQDYMQSTAAPGDDDDYDEPAPKPGAAAPVAAAGEASAICPHAVMPAMCLCVKDSALSAGGGGGGTGTKEGEGEGGGCAVRGGQGRKRGHSVRKGSMADPYALHRSPPLMQEPPRRALLRPRTRRPLSWHCRPRALALTMTWQPRLNWRRWRWTHRRHRWRRRKRMCRGRGHRQRRSRSRRAGSHRRRRWRCRWRCRRSRLRLGPRSSGCCSRSWRRRRAGERGCRLQCVVSYREASWHSGRGAFLLVFTPLLTR